jgi:hypothetical protein
MNDSPRLPYGYEYNVTCTEDKTGRVVIHWPEGCRGTVISRELLDAIVEEKNNCQRWIPVGERLPEENVRVLVFDKAFRQPEMGTYYAADGWVGDEMAMLDPTHWMPLPEPPEAKR